MDREANLAVPRAPPLTSLARQVSSQATSSSSSFSSSPELFRHVQAAFKRHRPLGTMQTSSIMPRRSIVPRRDAIRGSVQNVVSTVGFSTSQDCDRFNGGTKDSSGETKNFDCVIPREYQEDASMTPPTIAGTTTNMSFNSFDAERNQHKMVDDGKKNNPVPLSLAEPQQVDGQRKVQFFTRSSVAYHGADDLMATGLENVSSHMGSLALTEMECNSSSQSEASTVVNNAMKIQHFQNPESENNLKPEVGISSLLSKGTTDAPDHLHQFRNFLGRPVTQPSVMGSSCATTTSVHSTSAPMLNPTTYFPQTHQEGSSLGEVEPRGDLNLRQPVNQEGIIQPMLASNKHTCGIAIDQTATEAQVTTSAINGQGEGKKSGAPKEHKCIEGKIWDLQPLVSHDLHKSTEVEGLADNCYNLQGQASKSKDLSSDVNLEQVKTVKKEKVATAPAPRKRNYDPEVFFKVNGKLYQRLGKIGSGGSSEVHKVISSDCTIYALKKIKLKGRDYGTAYGFCQEIDYLKKLKGKNNIIQLIDYEVTDKNLLREVINGSISNKENRVKDDGYIYMVLEYGEIDLASMLSQKWKELGSSNQSIDESWLRFYWQQILLAVNTIHEERIVHSDLKPANFLLVKGSLKLIDFGIAKAIMSDTTNIQRDSQVGTLSYMSPEAFMCNESDANGNTIKCGRSSDIWSLGCILYQMVYGRTPFADYKTFWSKFKVITDPNHEITYGPVSNPFLLDLMKKCLAWDRNARWRIPQLLKHPFLVPHSILQPPLAEGRSSQFLHIIAKACVHDDEALCLYSQLSQLINDPLSHTKSESPSSGEQLRLLSQLSKVCVQLHECLGKLEEEKNLSHTMM